jgi:hypothetical protein
MNWHHLDVRTDSTLRNGALESQMSPSVAATKTGVPRLINDVVLFFLAVLICFGLTVLTNRAVHSPYRGLPYRDHFESSDNREWSAYGGNWKIESGTMVNESDERGGKLVTGSAYWEDYAIEADVALGNRGDAGLLVRVSDPEQGVDSYNGIYVGLRHRDQALVVGMADHDWQEAPIITLPSPIVSNSWYHIRVELRGCHIRAVANREGFSEKTEATAEFDNCPRRGKIGLRSYDSGGMWKNVRVTRLETQK